MAAKHAVTRRITTPPRQNPSIGLVIDRVVRVSATVGTPAGRVVLCVHHVRRVPSKTPTGVRNVLHARMVSTIHPLRADLKMDVLVKPGRS